MQDFLEVSEDKKLSIIEFVSGFYHRCGFVPLTTLLKDKSEDDSQSEEVYRGLSCLPKTINLDAGSDRDICTCNLLISVGDFLDAFEKDDCKNLLKDRRIYSLLHELHEGVEWKEVSRGALLYWESVFG